MNVVIAGYGAEGKSNYEYYLKRGDFVTIADERLELDDAPDDAALLLGEDAFARLNGFDLVVRTAGLAPSKISTDGQVWSATNEFFAECPAPIIGVTGSKGKGTTCSLITSILRAAGKTVHLVGNIGVPALDVLPKISAEDIVVYELSSFQLWDLERSPSVAVVLHMEPDHLDVHASFEEYIEAKANIRVHQKDSGVCFYHPTNVFSKQIATSLTTENDEQVLPYNTVNERNDRVSVAFVDGQNFFASRKNAEPIQICPLNALQLPGVHNQENACAAISVSLLFTDDFSAVERGLRDFSGLPHRLKFVRTVDEVRYYDDSIATTPGSASAALAAFSEPKVLIMGGSTKGADFTDFAKVAQRSNIRKIILIGDEAARIAAALDEHGVATENLGSEVTMTQVVGEAHASAVTGDVVVLSPACASFGMFKNYADRGDQFIAAVQAL